MPCKTTLGEIADQSIAQSGPNDLREFVYIDISSIDRETKQIVNPKVIATPEAPSRAKQVLCKGDVLISMTRPNLNAVALVPAAFDGAIGSTGFHVLRSSYIEPSFLFYLVQSNAFVDDMCRRVQGALYPAVRPADISSFGFFLPSYFQQHRIVAKIEELFSELDKGVEALKTAQHQLKVYRQAVLKWAFEGKLTEEWRKQHLTEGAGVVIHQIQKQKELLINDLITKRDAEAKRLKTKIEKHSFIKPDKALPDGWKWTSFVESCLLVVDCHNKTAPYEDEGIYLVRTPNIRNGKLLLNEEIRYVSDATYRYWSRRCPPQPGDILFTREAPMGAVAIIPENLKVCMGQRIMLLRVIPKLLVAKYLLYAIMDSMFQKRAFEAAIGTGVKHLRVGDVESLVFPICSTSEQIEIVQQIESRLSVADKLEESINQSLAQAEALRQSILKKAFEGRLVPQDPNDEPASVLLARIKAEREKDHADKAPRRRPRKTNTKKARP